MCIGEESSGWVGLNQQVMHSLSCAGVNQIFGLFLGFQGQFSPGIGEVGARMLQKLIAGAGVVIVYKKLVCRGRFVMDQQA